MRSLFVVVGVAVVLILLVSSGTVGGGFCIKGVGCLSSDGNGARIDDTNTVTVSTPP